MALEQRLADTKAEATAAMKRLARSILQIRDLMNIPLQTIECAMAVMRHSGQTSGEPAVIGSMERAFERLCSLNALLSRREAKAD